jgi:hypothetical protein
VGCVQLPPCFEEHFYVHRIPDPDATQPENWDTRRVIPDEAAVKPAGWLDHEPEYISDPGVNPVLDDSYLGSQNCRIAVQIFKREAGLD